MESANNLSQFLIQTIGRGKLIKFINSDIPVSAQKGDTIDFPIGKSVYMQSANRQTHTHTYSPTFQLIQAPVPYK